MPDLPPELLAALQRDPFGRDAHLVAADWLEEAGDADHGRLVRLQWALESPEVPPSPQEAGRLRNEAEELVVANRRRWLGAELTRPGMSWTFARGFARNLYAEGLTPEDAAELPLAAPLLESLVQNDTPGLPPESLAHVGALPLLTYVNLHVAPPSGLLTWDEVEPLAALSRLADLRLTGAGRRDLTREHAARLNVRRRERMRALPAEDRAAAFRLALRPHLAELPAGLRLSVKPSDSYFADAPEVAGVTALGLNGADQPRWLAKMAGIRSLTHFGLETLDVPLVASLKGLRELRLSTALSASVSGRELADLLGRLPRSLSAFGFTGVLHNPEPLVEALSKHKHLRLLELRTDLSPETLAKLSHPHLIELRLNDSLGLPADPRSAFPSLFALYLAHDGRAMMTRANAPAEVQPLSGRSESVTPEVAAARLPGSWGRDETLDGVRLRLPRWLERVEPPPARPDAEPVAAWRDFGDPDGTGDGVHHAPTRVVLERIPRKLPATERAAALYRGGLPGTLRWERVRQVKASAAVHARTEVAAVGHYVRYHALWVGKSVAYRLRADGAPDRLLRPDRWLPAVADSLRMG